MAETSATVLVDPLTGVTAAISLLRDAMFALQGPPPQVVVVYDGQSKAYGRERLGALSLDEVLSLFKHDFGIVGPSQGCLLDQSFNVTFYRTHGSGDADGPIKIDSNSFQELLQNVTRVELEVTRVELQGCEVGGSSVMVSVCFIVCLAFTVVFSAIPALRWAIKH